MSSAQLLSVVLILASVLVLTAPLPSLLALDVLVVPLDASWVVSGVRFDPTDALLFSLFLRLVIRRPEQLRRSFSRLPCRKLWLLAIVLLAVSYFVTPAWQGGPRDFSNPLATAWQLYRYNLRPVLYFAVAFVVLGGYKRFSSFAWVIIVSGDLLAVTGILDAWETGDRASGPFDSPNALGAALIVPFVLSLVTLVNIRSRGLRFFSLVSLLLIARALLYTSSRGAVAGVLMGVLVFVLGMFRRRIGRNRLFRMVPAAVLAIVLAFAIRPDLLERPNVQRLSGIAAPMEEGTFNWRVTRRWGRYTELVLEHPWFGTGLAYDPALRGTSAGTPHNSYLSLALLYGIPVMFLYTLFGLVAVRRGLASQSTAIEEHLKVAGLAVAACLSGLLVHAMTDGILLSPLVSKFYWILAAAGTSLPIKPKLARRAAATRPLVDLGHQQA